MANLSALTETATFAVTMVPAARTKIVEGLTGGFDEMYRVHRLFG